MTSVMPLCRTVSLASSWFDRGQMSGLLRGGLRRKLLWTVAPFALTVLGWVRHAEARRGGIVVDSCHGCHGDGSAPPELTLSADPPMFEPGERVTFTLTVQRSSMSVAGTFITAGGVGSFETLAGEGLGVSAQGLTHTSPKSALNGEVTFRFAWQAPAEPGGVDFRVLALAANGNNAVTGDAPGAAAFQWVFGCPGQSFFVDLDRDGYGAERLGIRLGCEGEPAPVGYALRNGDCDENSELVHPEAVEICNHKDDDCDGEIDEEAPSVTMWPDEDGDGYYSAATGTSVLGCGNVSGFAAVAGDCDDRDVALHPAATEVCNAKDDDCDGDVDDHVRPQCGLGWCNRYSTTCDVADCEPGPPAVETCNNFDDDCDGENDNDACPTGMVCWERECVANASVSDPALIDAGTASGGSSGGPIGTADVDAQPSSAGGTSAPEVPVAEAASGSETATVPNSSVGPGASGAASSQGPGSPAGTDALPGMGAAATSGTPSERSAGAGTERSACAVRSVTPGSYELTRTAWPGVLTAWLILVLLRRRWA
jgi:hypothetical protein